ncbi:MAG: hypothetical protein ACKOZU_03350 [Planctomycetaceae bacterium]
MPSIPRRAGLVLVALVVLGAGGCGGKAGRPSKAKAERPIVPAEVDAESAVRVDDGRITVAPPLGWRREPRSKDYLARYLPGSGKTYPSVTVLGGDPPAGVAAVDEANHAEFVAAMTESLAGQFTSADGKSTLLRKAAAAEVGPHRAVVWAAPGTAKVDGLSQPIERSCTAVVVAGRMYTIEARAPKGKLDDAGRAAGRGVAAGIAAAEEESEPAPAGEPEAPPAAEEPPRPQDGTDEPAAPAAN